MTGLVFLAYIKAATKALQMFKTKGTVEQMKNEDVACRSLSIDIAGNEHTSWGSVIQDMENVLDDWVVQRGRARGLVNSWLSTDLIGISETLEEVINHARQEGEAVMSMEILLDWSPSARVVHIFDYLDPGNRVERISVPSVGTPSYTVSGL